MSNFLGIAGILVILLLALALSTNRRAIRPRVVGAAFALQVVFAILALYLPAGHQVVGCSYFYVPNGIASADYFRSTGHEGIVCLSSGVTNMLGYAHEGTNLIFGAIATDPKFGNSFAMGALPVIIFFAALVAVLYHVGIMQFVIRWIGGAIEKLIGVSKVESLCAAANIFVGQSEAPLVIRPYLAALTPSQLFAVMTVGMAGVAGTILAAYALLLGPGALPYLLAASFMSAPGGLLMAKIVMPDDIVPAGELPLEDAKSFLAHEDRGVQLSDGHPQEERAANIIMAAANGAQTGVKIAVSVAAMVLAFVSLVALANGLLGGIGGWFGYPQLSFQGILGYVFAPVMFLLNIPWNEATIAGQLFGQKIVLNEFVAFIELGKLQGLSKHTVAIVTFALCGFANFSSIAIQMASTGSLAPNQKPMIAKLGLRALAAGSLANLMSAALAGLLVG
jgi:CNT family concentrative nucleoside transporter